MEVSKMPPSVSLPENMTAMINPSSGKEEGQLQSKEEIENKMLSGLLPHAIAELKEKMGQELTVSEKMLIQAVEKANRALNGVTTNLKFSIHNKTRDIIVKVIDSETREVIREIPPEKMVDMFARMMEMTGLLVDEKR